MSSLTTALSAAVADLTLRQRTRFEPARPEPATAAPDQPTIEIDCPARLEDRCDVYAPIGPSTGSRP